MIIGIDISQIVYKTGVSRYTRELVKNLLKIDKDNQYKLYAGVLKQFPAVLNFIKELKAEGYKFQSYIYPIPPKFAEKYWNRWRVMDIERLIGKVDVFHCSDWTQPRCRGKKIATVHDLTPILFAKYHEAYLIDCFKQNLKLIEKEVDQVITVSKATEEDLVNNSIITRDKVEVIYSGVDKKFAPASETECNRVKTKYKLDKPYILSVGTKEPRKNIGRLIEAFQSLANQDIDLVLAGKYGWGENHMSNLKSQMSNIKEIGFVGDKDLPAFYSGAQVFAYPSLYEGFGMPILEAMACGCPVITSNISSLPEVAGDAALLVYPKDEKEIAKAMMALVDDEKLRNKLIKRGYEQVKKFSWQKTAEKTLELYHKIAA